VTASARSRTWLPALALLGGLVLVTLLIGAGPDHPGNLDPRSTEAGGTKALVMLLDASGATVSVTDRQPGAGTDVALLLSDTTSTGYTAQLRSWVEAGGVLVVADPYSSFAPPRATAASVFAAGAVRVDRGDCDIPAMVGLYLLASPEGVTRFKAPDRAGRCFADRTGSFVVDSTVGAGHVVAIGDADVFMNATLDQADNAGLAVALMAARPGTRVSVLWGMRAGGSPAAGHGDLASLVSTGVKLAIVELVVAFGLYAWWRARRLGQPVVEHQPVQIGGSELVRAHGNLLEQTRDPDRAARLLRSDLRRRLSERLGLPSNATPHVVAEVTAARTPVERERVERAVTDAPIRSEDDLLDLARDIDAIRTEVLHGSAP
jgi:Domain of unknown function (DUF4350)